MQASFDNIARSLNLPLVCIITFLFLIGWAVFGAFVHNKMKVIGTAAAAASAAVILFITVLSRSRINSDSYFIPFSTFLRAQENSDLYIFMLMNIILFIPLGFSLPYVFRGSPGKRIGMTIIAGFFFSLAIEIIQYVFSVGYADVDDIIVNTLGTAIGSISYLLTVFIKKKRKTEQKKKQKKIG